MSRARSRLAAALSAALLLFGCGGGDDDVVLLPARRGDIEVLLRLKGSLRPGSERNIKSPRWGEIRRLAANGSRVKAGEIVLEMDSERVENSIRKHQADVEVSAAELRQVRQEVGKYRRRSKLSHATARLNRELEESRLKELLARPTPRELADAGSRLNLAEALVTAGGESVVLIKELVDAGYAPRDDLRAAELQLARARADLAAARAGLKRVKAGPTVSEKAEATIRLGDARLAELSAGKSIEITKEWTGAKLARFTRKLERQKEKLGEARRQLMDYQARAPNDGVVLYAKRRHGGTWQPGRSAWQGATIMSIPDLSKMKLTIQVPASSVRQLEALGKARARVRVKALPGVVFKARLAKISAIGRDEFEGLDPSTSGKLGRAERQVFEAEVELENPDPRLKPGFGAEAELILRRVKNAVIVPRVALVGRVTASGGGPARRRGRGGRGGKPSAPRPAPTARVYVKTGDGFQECVVKILAVNKFEAAVEGSVREGDMLYPGLPPGFASPSPAPKKSGKPPAAPVRKPK